MMRKTALLGILALLAVPARAEFPEGHDHFRILPPLPQARVPLRIDPSVLPAGARAHFPAHDGDGIVVTFPVAIASEVPADRVFANVIVPILASIGFPRAGIQRGFRFPPSAGLAMPRADFSGLAQDVDFEYEASPRLLRPGTRDMIDSFLRGEATPEVDAALEMGEGMNFAQFVANIERLVVEYPFQQIVDDVPIEHTLLLASRWEEQDVTAVRGRVFVNFDVKNRAKLTQEEAIAAGLKEIGKLRETAGFRWQAASSPVLVLLPYGSDDQGRTRLLHAYRIRYAELKNGPARGQSLRLWLDAQNGRILKLNSFLEPKGVAAKGRVWIRDPGIGTVTASFKVDPAQNNSYELKYDKVIKKVDLYQKADLTLNAANPNLADFDQPPTNDAAQALCDSGANDGFQEVNAFAHLFRGVQTANWSGIFQPFPKNFVYGTFNGWYVDVEHINCEANASMLFGACEGYRNVACPNYWNGEPFDGDWTENCLNYAHDASVLSHELGHHATQVLTVDRPDDWCGNNNCPIPVEDWDPFHGLADAWNAHLQGTNCDGGWVCKNRGGPNYSLNCAHSDEGGGSPRLSQVTVPFNPATPADHFPEHPESGDYANMQIPTAALWEVRLGMRSKCRPSGVPQFGVRFVRALRETGWLPYAGQKDVFLFQQLYDLELAMVEQWATSGSQNGPPAFKHNGPHTTNKVTAGFAKAGLFLIPYQCLDGDLATTDFTSCPNGELGADAVIDIDDNDPADDLTLNGVTHLEVDFLEVGGPAPAFHVWTGPRYRLDGMDGSATITNPSPCNRKFQVDISKDPTFQVGTVTSPWILVDRNPNSPNTPECYDTWTPNPAQWNTIDGQPLERLYYRVRTVDENDQNLRSSTSPGNGLWVVPPPYAVFTANGQSDY